MWHFHYMWKLYSKSLKWIISDNKVVWQIILSSVWLNELYIFCHALSVMWHWYHKNIWDKISFLFTSCVLFLLMIFLFLCTCCINTTKTTDTAQLWSTLQIWSFYLFFFLIHCAFKCNCLFFYSPWAVCNIYKAAKYNICQNMTEITLKN